MAVAVLGPSLRQADNLVSAVNFDFRSFDTLGEEFMLLGAVVGAVMLLRGIRGEQAAPGPLAMPMRERADSSRLVARVATPLLFVYGCSLVAHATVTPGGGFQGGAVIASAMLLVYLGEGYAVWRKAVVSHWLAALEGAGAFGFACAGLFSLAFGRAFMANMMPLGERGKLFSGGVMLVENLGVALAVSAGILMLFLEFLEETRTIPGSGRRK